MAKAKKAKASKTPKNAKSTPVEVTSFEQKENQHVAVAEHVAEQSALVEEAAPTPSLPSDAPSLERFEAWVCERNDELACQELLAILSKIDSNFGNIQGISYQVPSQIQYDELQEMAHFCTRLAAAVSQLFMAKDFYLSPKGALDFLTLQRWLSLIFGSSPYHNADHVLRTYNVNPEETTGNNVHLPPEQSAFFKFCVLYLMESNITLNLDTIYEISPKLAVSLCIALQSSRFIGTESAFAKRHAILKWLPEKLAMMDSFDGLPTGILHDVYMHCSYDIDENKHQIKWALNQVIRRHILQLGWQDRAVNTINTVNGKPVMLVLLEHFNAGHSIYRTHSTSILAARQHFHIIGVGSSAVDTAGREVFDQFYELEGSHLMDRLSFLRELCERFGVAVFYMPSIGMDLTTIFASNTRLAPIQVIALGHPATTHSNFVDYVLVEDDYVGAEECFSEALIRLPKDALPYVPARNAPASVEYRWVENPEVVHIGVAATTMKLNPYFLSACREIMLRSHVPVHFHFALGQSIGVTHIYAKRFVESYLGTQVTVYHHSPYEQYLKHLYQCDMMINPFPFGNTNGIIDMVTLGLVGVCKTGREVHEHIDEGLFKRLGLPTWLIAQTAEEYIECAVRLAENHEERLALRRHVIENNGLQTLFTGNPEPLGNVLLEKLQAKM
ncbi:MAG: hypothetical protein Q4B71_00145 [Cardiobacteriaceae bacterium]|nr:hypothetical protein [Cardiobacteriaceae bacterium]